MNFSRVCRLHHIDILSVTSYFVCVRLYLARLLNSISTYRLSQSHYSDITDNTGATRLTTVLTPYSQDIVNYNEVFYSKVHVKNVQNYLNLVKIIQIQSLNSGTACIVLITTYINIITIKI